MDYLSNITQYWADVSGPDKQAGCEAYPAYHEMMRRISHEYDEDPTIVTEVFAALSPNNDYYGNLRSTTSVLNGVQSNQPYIITTYKACGLRAETYLDRSESFLSKVKGPKITAFRNCIVDPFGCSDFVVDGHMIAIVLDMKLTMKGATALLKHHKYRDIERAYCEFSKQIDMTPSSVQAAMWYSRKRRESILQSSQLDMWRPEYKHLYHIDEIPPYNPLRGPIQEILE